MKWTGKQRKRVHEIRGEERGEDGKEIGNILEETMAENVPNLMKNICLHNREAQETPKRIN